MGNRYVSGGLEKESDGIGMKIMEGAYLYIGIVYVIKIEIREYVLEVKGGVIYRFLGKSGYLLLICFRLEFYFIMYREIKFK